MELRVNANGELEAFNNELGGWIPIKYPDGTRIIPTKNANDEYILSNDEYAYFGVPTGEPIQSVGSPDVSTPTSSGTTPTPTPTPTPTKPVGGPGAVPQPGDLSTMSPQELQDIAANSEQFRPGVTHIKGTNWYILQNTPLATGGFGAPDPVPNDFSILNVGEKPPWWPTDNTPPWPPIDVKNRSLDAGVINQEKDNYRLEPKPKDPVDKAINDAIMAGIALGTGKEADAQFALANYLVKVQAGTAGGSKESLEEHATELYLSGDIAGAQVIMDFLGTPTATQIEQQEYDRARIEEQQEYDRERLAEQTKNLEAQRGVENTLARDRLTMSDQQFQQTYGLSKNQFMAGEDQRSFENRFAQDQFNANQEQLQFSNQQALTDQAFRATELGLDLLNSPGDLFTFLTRLRGEQGSLPFQQGGQAIPRTFPFTFNQATPPQPFGLRDRDWAPQDYDWGPGGYQQPKVPQSPLSPPREDPVTGELIPNPFDMPDIAPSPLLVAPSASRDAVREIMRDQAAAEDPITWDVAQQIADMEIQTTPPATAPIGEVATTSMMAPRLGAGATSPMGGTIAQAGMINPTAQTSPSQQLGFGGTGTRTVTPSGMPTTTLQPFGLPTSTVGPLPRQGLSQAFLGMPPTGRRTLASLGAPPALSAQSMTRLTPTERSIRLSEAKAQGFSEQDFLEEDRRHQMTPGTGRGRARFTPGRFRG